MLTGHLPGSSVIPAAPDPERLRALGAVAARISSVTLSPTRALPVRQRPIEAEDFARLRREQGASDLLRAAEAAVARAGAAVIASAGLGNGRPDLTREIMLERRDAFLAAALSQLEAGSYQPPGSSVSPRQ